MKRWTVLGSVAVAVLVVAAVLFVITTQSSPSFTNRVGCTGYEVIVAEGSSFTNGSIAYETATTVTSFTTTTNTSATVGHTIANSFTQPAYPNPPLIEASFSGSCTFIK